MLRDPALYGEVKTELAVGDDEISLQISLLVEISFNMAERNGVRFSLSCGSVVLATYLLDEEF